MAMAWHDLFELYAHSAMAHSETLDILFVCNM
jgi:hypothetical protein